MEDQSLFSRERQVIRDAEDLLDTSAFRDGPCAAHYEKLLRHYEKMFAQMRRIMRISDRFEDALRASVREQEVLLREVHHRVKNNLASIIGMLNLQARFSDNEVTAAVLADLSDRIRSMSLVHETLYRSEKLARVDCQSYFKTLISHLITSLAPKGRIACNVEAAGSEMNLDTAIPCGMIVNELITNALKHAFPEGKPGSGGGQCGISISLKCEGATYTLVVTDNGVGLPAHLDWKKASTLGLRLVRMLGEHQLGGHIDLDRACGAQFTFTFESRHNKTTARATIINAEEDGILRPGTEKEI